MSFKVELTVEDKTYTIRRFVAFLERENDAKGRPTSDIRWRLDLLMDAVNDITITGWMLDPKKQIDGKLTIYKIAEESTLKEIEFKKCVCCALRDHFSSRYSFASCKLTIAGKEIKINTAAFIHSWPGS